MAVAVMGLGGCSGDGAKWLVRIGACKGGGARSLW